MSTSIGELSVGVSLDLKKMDAGLAELDRKTKAQVKQLDAEYAKLGGGAFGFSGGGGGGGSSGGGRFSRAMGGGGGKMGSFARNAQNIGYQAGDVAAQVNAGGSVINAIGQQLPQILQAFGPYGALAGALVGSAFAFRKELMTVGEDFVDALSGGMGSVARELADSMDAALAEKAAKNGFGSFKELLAAVQGQRAANKQFQKDQFFSKQDDQGKVSILEKEIVSLTKRQRAAKNEGLILEVEKINGEVAQKRAEIESLNKQIEDRKKAFDLTTQQQQNARWNADQADKIKQEDAGAGKKLERDFKATAPAAPARPDIQGPFSGSNIAMSASGFGSAGDTAGGIMAGIKERAKYEREMIDILSAIYTKL